MMPAFAVAAAFAIAAPASATIVFFDGFEGDAPDTGYTTLVNWTAFGGTVDIVASSNPWGIVVSSPATGNVLDLDGTPGPAALVSNATFNFNAGDVVTLSFDVGGAQRGSISDDFLAGLAFDESLASNIFGTGLTASPDTALGGVTQGLFLAGATPFTTSSIGFKALAAGSLQIAFVTQSQDNIGPLLDNVKLSITPIPEPASWAMMLFGIGAVGAAMRRRQKVAVRYAA
jgi:hypothetical protein